MPRGVSKNGKRKIKAIEKDKYSSHYTVKVGLQSLLLHHPTLLPTIQTHTLEITRVALRITRFINVFVLRHLENNCDIPSLDQGFIQHISSVLFGPNSKTRDGNVALINKSINMDDVIIKLRKIYKNLATSIGYVARSLSVNISNMLKFTLEQRLRKYLRLRMNQLHSDASIPKSEYRRIVEYIIRRLTFTTPVYDFIKLPPKELVKTIPVLTQEIRTFVGAETDEIIDESFVDDNTNNMLKFYWHVQQFFTNNNMKSFALLPLSHFKCRCMEIGTAELTKMVQPKKNRGRPKKDDAKVAQPIEFKYNLKCLHTGGKKLQISSIRTDGIQVSVVIRHELVGNHKNNKTEKSNDKKPAKKRKKETSVNEGANYLIGIDPGIVTLMSCADSDGRKWEFSNRTYRRLSHHSQNTKRLLKYKAQWNTQTGKDLDALHNSIKQASVSTSDLFIKHIDSVLKVEEDLLDFYCTPKVKRLNWDSYIMRDKAIANVMNDFSKRANGKKMIIGMGNAGFGSCYKGHASTPKGKLLKKLNERFEVKMIDEFMTSQKCCACHSHLKPVKHKRMDKKGVSAISIVRGVKQCTTTKCLVTHNRDVNAAKNMLHLLKTEINGKTRPKVFERKRDVAKQLNQMVEHLYRLIPSSQCVNPITQRC
jgi:hypothetical protein